MKQAFRILAATAAVAGVMAGGSARADVVLSGPDAYAGSYSTSALSALAVPADTFDAGGLTGISLWGLLGGAASSSPTSPIYGGITTSTPAGDNNKNAILRYFLLGTDASGAHSVVSLGEINPSFGGTAAVPAFVAFQATGGGLLTAPQLIVPGVPGRNLSDLTSLQLLSVAALPTGAGGISDSVQLSGTVTNPGAYTKTDLQTQFTPVTETVGTDTYTGVPLWNFLNPSGGDNAGEIVVAAATDGYEVVYSLAELDPNLGGNPDNLLPYADTGTDFPDLGVARTILPLDNRHGRWESNLTSLLVTEVPEPATLMLFGFAVLALGTLRRRAAR